MSNTSTLSVSDKLLIASFKLEQKGKVPFSAEDLVVAAWENFPDTFGLRGYRDNDGKLRYPDSNRVFAEIMGSKPIRKKGYLMKVGTKTYKLTESGIEYAKFLHKQVDKPAPEKAAFPREIEAQLKLLFASRAVRKMKENRESDITFFDACNFWKISPGSSSIEFQVRLENFNNMVSIVRKIIGDKSVSFEHSGEEIDSKDLDFLKNLSETLLEKFDNELELIRKRKSER